MLAVHPPAPVLGAVAALRGAESPGVRWTRRSQWHVTRRFLGEADVSVWLSLGVTAALAVPTYAWAQYLFTTGKKLKD